MKTRDTLDLLAFVAEMLEFPKSDLTSQILARKKISGNFFSEFCSSENLRFNLV